MKRFLTVLCTVFFLCLPCAQALEYSVPSMGLRLDLPQGWTSQALYEEQWRLVSAEGMEVSILRMEGEAPAVEDYSHAPYENAAFSDSLPGYLTLDYTLQAGEETVSYACALTHENGYLYQFTASGAPLSDLREALTSLLSHVSFQKVTVMQETAADAALPEPVLDDGDLIPISLEQFTGLTLEDKTTVTVRTLPGTLVALITPADELYETADEEGLCSFILSTRQEQVYSYTLMTRASGRSSSSLSFSIERRFSRYGATASYRASASKLEILGYRKVAAAPGDFAGCAVSFRGKIAQWTDADGLPCLLVYTENPSKGVWEDPVWVRLSHAFGFALNDVRTIYGDISGETLPFEGQELPLIDCRSISEE